MSALFINLKQLLIFLQKKLSLNKTKSLNVPEKLKMPNYVTKML